MILQPSEMFRLLKIENTEEAERVLSTALEFLVYMKVGYTLKTGLVTFKKISNDLIHMDVKIDPNDFVDALEKAKVIRIPI